MILRTLRKIMLMVAAACAFTLAAADAYTAGVIVGSKFVTLLEQTHNALQAIKQLKRVLEK